MFDFFLSLAIFGSFVWFCIILLIVLSFLFISESREDGTIAFTAFIVFAVINHFWGNIPLFSYFTWENILIYLGIGFIYAIIKSFFYGRNSKDDTYNTKINKLKGNVFRWWTLWPISLTYWVFSDLFKDLYEWLYKHIGKLFEYFFKLGQGKTKEQA